MKVSRVRIVGEKATTLHARVGGQIVDQINRQFITRLDRQSGSRNRSLEGRGVDRPDLPGGSIHYLVRRDGGAQCRFQEPARGLAYLGLRKRRSGKGRLAAPARTRAPV